MRMVHEYEISLVNDTVDGGRVGDEMVLTGEASSRVIRAYRDGPVPSFILDM